MTPEQLANWAPGHSETATSVGVHLWQREWAPPAFVVKTARSLSWVWIANREKFRSYALRLRVDETLAVDRVARLYGSDLEVAGGLIILESGVVPALAVLEIALRKIGIDP